MRKGQMEMIGLVFVVVIIVFGILLYLKFSTRGDTGGITKRAEVTQSQSAFLVALKETDIPSCQAPFWRVAKACLENDPFCTGEDACAVLQDTIQTIADLTLTEQGTLYDIRLKGTDVQYAPKDTSTTPEPLCDVEDLNEEFLISAAQPIAHTGGQADLLLTICK